MMQSPGRTVEDHENAQRELSAAWKAGSILRKNRPNAYEKACRALMPESRECWDESVAGGVYQADAQSLATYIRDVLEPVLKGMEKQARYQPEIKAQTLGEGLQPQKLEQLSRYETHLDRKFERTLGMLLKLKELRGGRAQ